MSNDPEHLDPQDSPGQPLEYRPGAADRITVKSGHIVAGIAISVFLGMGGGIPRDLGKHWTRPPHLKHGAANRRDLRRAPGTEHLGIRGVSQPAIPRTRIWTLDRDRSN